MGKYVDKNLLNNEVVIHEGSYHWTHYISWLSLCTLGIYPYIQGKTDEFVVTSKRIIIKKGIIAYDTLEMNLSRVESVQVEQTVLGRILGFGSVKIIGTGGTKETFEHIKDPVLFRKYFNELI